jgi:hypothetical protein
VERYEKQLTGHRVQIDVKFIEPLAHAAQGRRGGRNKHHRFTVTDDSTRLRVLRICPKPNQADADLAGLRLGTPYEPRPGRFEAFFHAGRLDFPEHRLKEILALFDTVPTVVALHLERPAVVPETADRSAALLAAYGADDKALLDVVFGRFRPEGRLPFQLPRSMREVEAGRPAPCADDGFCRPAGGTVLPSRPSGRRRRRARPREQSLSLILSAILERSRSTARQRPADGDPVCAPDPFQVDEGGVAAVIPPPTTAEESRPIRHSTHKRWLEREYQG